jgi:hypothetical protein
MSPAWLPLRPEAIPAVLQALPWVLWRAESRGPGKPTKVPYRIADPRRHASSTDPTTWGRFADAVDAQSCAELRAAGIGVVLTEEAGITCLDLDAVLDRDRHLDPRAAEIVRRADSWAEISPSGRGLHIFVVGTVPTAIKGVQIEVYSTARFIAVTGHHWPHTPDDLQPGQAYLDQLVALVYAQHLPRRPYTGPTLAPPDDLAGALLATLEAFGLTGRRIKPWSGGYLVELEACPWASEHTAGPGGAAVIIHPSGAYDFVCLHSHCAGRDWRAFRSRMEALR